ncbi:MAG: cytochrome b/b6 domain-containing protein [Anaerolineaceae bacterium]|nr:cytochrome b/b6 domain-containing protein [Anaerolineaceae bacterium]
MKLPKLNKTKINVFLDLLLALFFIVEMEEHFTGLPIHEILGLVFGATFLLHVLLHWDWIGAITIGFFRQLLHESRFNYLLNWALFVAMGLATLSGILISRTLGLNISVDHSWEQIHRITADLSLLIVALHVAMHWKWIAENGTKYLFGWIPRLFSGRSRTITPAQPQES